MLSLIVGTGNENKVAELAPLLSGLGLALIAANRLAENDKFNPVEDGDSLEANAIIKANAALDLLRKAKFDGWAISDDTGVFVDALDGRPGIYAARYAGEGVPFHANIKKVLEELGDTPYEKRTATFTTVIALCRNKHEPLTFKGSLHGKILKSPRGNSGFGYDPVFEIDGIGKTLAELSASDKNIISHRAIAVNLCRIKLRLLLENGDDKNVG